ncbi:MAG: hypothetical protein CM15mP127_14410 [Gammaproteobacteria bacterium]|nr:MAG: hypothetical protein CM15mP127_14410 [Gammaproteobacteria bacterium]
MIDKVTMTSATWNEVPYKFEAGTKLCSGNRFRCGNRLFGIYWDG